MNNVVMLDWVVLAVLGGSLLLGIWRGLVFEVLSLLGWLAAFVAAQWLASDLALRLPLGQMSGSIRFAVGFVVVFVVAAFAFGLLASLVKQLVQAAGLSPVDRALGAVFGLLRGVLLLCIAAVLVHLVGLNQSSWWQESIGAGVLNEGLHIAKPLVPAGLAKFLP